MSKNLYKQDIWDAGYKDFDFFEATPADPVASFILQNTADINGTCFEVGCFPGRYLAMLGQKCWEINGIDLTPYLDKLEDWLRHQNCQVGTLTKQDFITFESEVQYDLVYSCGFIEHFIAYKDIIRKHAQLVKPGGKLIITTPNFTRFQGVLHQFFDDENYYRHNIVSMNLKSWQQVLLEEGFTIEKSAYFGKFAFWTGWQPRPKYKLFLLNKFNNLLPLVTKIIQFDSAALSPFLGIVAKRNG